MRKHTVFTGVCALIALSATSCATAEEGQPLGKPNAQSSQSVKASPLPSMADDAKLTETSTATAASTERRADGSGAGNTSKGNSAAVQLPTSNRTIDPYLPPKAVLPSSVPSPVESASPSTEPSADTPAPSQDKQPTASASSPAAPKPSKPVPVLPTEPGVGNGAKPKSTTEPKDPMLPSAPSNGEKPKDQTTGSDDTAQTAASTPPPANFNSRPSLPAPSIPREIAPQPSATTAPTNGEQPGTAENTKSSSPEVANASVSAQDSSIKRFLCPSSILGPVCE